MFLGIILLLISISISSVSAYFSIYGLTSIFPGAYYAVILMGIVLEFGKLGSVAFLHIHSIYVKYIRYFLISIIFVLMLINAMGIFGYLSKSHIEQEVINSGQTQSITLIQSKIENELNSIKDIDKQTNLIDNALDKLTQTGRASTALTQITAQKKTKDVWLASKLQHQTVLENLKQEELKQNLNNKKIEADFGPLKYIADVIYLNPTNSNLETVVTWLIIVIIFVFDPLALILLKCSLLIFDIVGNNKKKVNYSLSPLEIRNEDLIQE